MNDVYRVRTSYEISDSRRTSPTRQAQTRRRMGLARRFGLEMPIWSRRSSSIGRPQICALDHARHAGKCLGGARAESGSRNLKGRIVLGEESASCAAPSGHVNSSGDRLGGMQLRRSRSGGQRAGPICWRGVSVRRLASSSEFCSTLLAGLLEAN